MESWMEGKIVESPVRNVSGKRT